jgi:hypothetical protein
MALEVFNPAGAFEIAQLHATRLDNLDGKTICEVWNDAWEGERTFPLIRELLQKQFPTAKIIPYSEVVEGEKAIQNLKYVAQQVQEKGCEAAIVGNAG